MHASRKKSHFVVFIVIQRHTLKGVMDVDKCHLCRNRNALEAGTFDMMINETKRNFKGSFGLTLHLAQLANKAQITNMIALAAQSLRFNFVERSMPPIGFFIGHGIAYGVR